ncbi:MAG TPA: DUF4157 domain-containing protein [Solirubrobacterales bacterium]|nr:DUF4157 domain-containing protein [Solirubrobacterales bacterium]
MPSHRQAHEPEHDSREAEGERSIECPSSPTDVAATIGNSSFSALAAEGAGILPDGRAHPDVEATIARTRNAGGTLADGVRASAEEALGESLADVRVHTDGTADALARSVAARAFTTGSDIYFARGEYKPASSDGERLIAHELAHVVQQRGAPTSGPMRVSEPGEDLEVDADEVARDLSG